MSKTLNPQDIVIGALGQNHLGKVKALVTGANPVKKGDTVVVTDLSFGPRGTPTAGKVTRATATSEGVLALASNDAAVGRQVVLVDWLPFQMDTSAGATEDPVFIGASGEPTLTPGTKVIGKVVTVGTSGSVLLQGALGGGSTAGSSIGPWTNLLLSMNYSSSAGGSGDWHPAQYRVITEPSGRRTVELRGGIITTGIVSNPIATMPEGLRPASDTQALGTEGSTFVAESLSIFGPGVKHGLLERGQGNPTHPYLVNLDGASYTVEI